MSNHHIVTPKTYIAVILSLFALTGLTVWVAFQPLDAPWNDVVAMAIAFTKATLVVLFFMHVKWGETTTKLSVVLALIFLLLLLGITLSDFLTRPEAGRKWRLTEVQELSVETPTQRVSEPGPGVLFHS